MINPQPTNRIPGSFGLPIVGQTLEFIANQGWQLDKYYHKYGAVFKLRLLGNPYVVLVGADANRLILQDQIDRVSSYLGWQPFVEHLWGVIVAQGLTHRLPSLYAHPETFDPARFLAPREEDKQHPFALVGFGGGAHRCIGMEFAKMEMKIFLATLLSKYDWTVQPTYDRIASVQVPPNIERHLRATVKVRKP
jgi:cytochrome P450